jgi:hypothetical protein
MLGKPLDIFGRMGSIVKKIKPLSLFGSHALRFEMRILFDGAPGRWFLGKPSGKRR